MDKNTQEVIASLKTMPEVGEVSLDLVSQQQSDPYFNDQWGWNNTGQTLSNGPFYGDPTGNANADSDVLEAWTETTGDPAVVVAIIDVDHPDLEANILKDAGGNVIGYDLGDNDSNPDEGSPLPIWGHGTHVAGIVAADDNGIGMTGVCPDCKIMPLKTSERTTNIFGDPTYRITLSGIVNSLFFAAGEPVNINGTTIQSPVKADVINLSFGIYVDPSGEINLPDGTSLNVPRVPNPFEQQAIELAYSNGVTLVGAAGNLEVDAPSYPASYNQVISVTNTDNKDEKSSKSSWNNAVDISAPGQDVLSTLPASSVVADGRRTGSLGEVYAYASGTSMAAPMVAGASGLV